MPTYQPRPRFLRDIRGLTGEQVRAWEKALDAFIECLRSGAFEPSLRVKRVQGYPGVWELRRYGSTRWTVASQAGAPCGAKLA